MGFGFLTSRLCLSALDELPPTVRRPDFDPRAAGVGIVHLGAGAFHRAHQAVYTDDALAADTGNWRIRGVSLRSTDIADALNPQNGLYTLVERGPDGTTARIVASIDSVIAASRQTGAALAAMVDPMTRIVSLTVTEKAYGIDRDRHGILSDHPSIAPDLRSPSQPRGAVGLLVEALRLRRERRLAPFTVLCCDNLPENGALLRAGVLDFAQQIAPPLARWIEASVDFPSTMVDRITPASTATTLADAAALTGWEDLAAVETESFSQWVIEDRFTGGRPAWEAGGVIFVDDVAAYERMKLRMLNGTHSMLAYAGFLTGHRYVRDVMADKVMAKLVARQLEAATGTLPNLAGIDLRDYAEALCERFANPAIAHETRQIAMDGTEKLPQRLVAPAIDVARRGGDLRPFAFAVAAWMRYALGRTEEGEPYALRDPLESEIRQAVAKSGTAAEIVAALHELDSLFPAELTGNRNWTHEVTAILGDMLERGIAATLAEEAARAG
jgi:fructuronate reductase